MGRNDLKTINKILFFFLLLNFFLSLNCICVTDTVTYADYSDTESSVGNTLTADVWNSSSSGQAAHLSILNSNIVQAQGVTPSYWRLTIMGASGIVIDKIQESWDTSQISNSHLTSIKIRNTEVFSGNKSSGELIDTNNYSFTSSSATSVYSYFDSDVASLTPLSINITMGDGSVKSYVTT